MLKIENAAYTATGYAPIPPFVTATLKLAAIKPIKSVEKGRLFPKGGYRSKWYQTGHSNKEICAIGIHGQWIWIDPIKEISIVMFSSRKMPLSITKDLNFTLLCEEICKTI